MKFIYSDNVTRNLPLESYAQLIRAAWDNNITPALVFNSYVAFELSLNVSNCLSYWQQLTSLTSTSTSTSTAPSTSSESSPSPSKSSSDDEDLMKDTFGMIFTT